MSAAEIHHELLQEIDHLRPDQQERVLKFARRLTVSKFPEGLSWDEMKKYRGIISQEEAEAMKKAIEEECERIDPEGW